MTKLSGDSGHVIRETSAQYRGRPIVVELCPGFMRLRIKGTREVHVLDYEVALACALKVEARSQGIKI